MLAGVRMADVFTVAWSWFHSSEPAVGGGSDPRDSAVGRAWLLVPATLSDQ